MKTCRVVCEIFYYNNCGEVKKKGLLNVNGELGRCSEAAFAV